MPYKDPEKRRDLDRRRKSKCKEVAADQPVVEDFSGRPQVSDVESAYGDEVREASIAAAIMRRYCKSRTWACIMYLDSMPPDWEDLLRQIGVGFAVPSQNDMDVTATGEIKKAHHHVILDWRGGSTTYRTAASIARDVLHGTIPVPLVSPRGYYRYFTHLDNPNKAQYDEKDIIRGGGFDLDDFAALTSEEKRRIRADIRSIIVEQNIFELWTLVEYVALNCPVSYDDYLSTNTLYFEPLLRSRRRILFPRK